MTTPIASNPYDVFYQEILRMLKSFSTTDSSSEQRITEISKETFGTVSHFRCKQLMNPVEIHLLLGQRNYCIISQKEKSNPETYQIFQLTAEQIGEINGTLLHGTGKYYLEQGHSTDGNYEYYGVEALAYDEFEPQIFKFRGKEFLYCTPSSEILPDTYWSTWHSLNKAQETYDSVIHPLFLKLASKWIKKIGRPVRILELGPGDGRLAKKILDKIADLVEAYSLVEYNAQEAEKARKLFEHKSIVTVQQADARTFDIASLSNLDIIITCGLLTHQVLCESDALMILDRISSQAPNGCLLMHSGLAKSHFGSINLMSRNWHIIKHMSKTHWFYIAQLQKQGSMSLSAM